MDPVTLVIVEDHVALRRGLELLLGRHGCVIVGTAGAAQDGYDVVTAKRPDVVLLDIQLPDQSGVALSRRLLEDDPELRILLYTGARDRETLAAAVDSGVSGFVLKACGPQTLRDAIHEVAAGRSYFDPDLRSLAADRSAERPIGVLSRREREVMGLLAGGLTGEGIAERLFVSPETVRTHVRNAMTKLEAAIRVHAVALALRTDEIEHLAATARPAWLAGGDRAKTA